MYATLYLFLRRNMLIESFSEKDTFELGKELGQKAKAGEIVCLDGDLGCGKTVFTKGFAEGMGIDDVVSSPTFTIIQEYDGEGMPLYHFDVYRIGDSEEMFEIGYEDYFFGEGVCLIEWASKIEDFIPKEAKHIIIEKDFAKSAEYRKITIEQ